jgi:hypothetical protein
VSTVEQLTVGGSRQCVVLVKSCPDKERMIFAEILRDGKPAIVIVRFKVNPPLLKSRLFRTISM